MNPEQILITSDEGVIEQLLLKENQLRKAKFTESQKLITKQITNLKKSKLKLEVLEEICFNFNFQLEEQLYLIACDGDEELVIDLPIDNFYNPLVEQLIKSSDILKSIYSLQQELNYLTLPNLLNEIEEIDEELEGIMVNIKENSNHENYNKESSTLEGVE